MQTNSVIHTCYLVCSCHARNSVRLRCSIANWPEKSSLFCSFAFTSSLIFCRKREVNFYAAGWAALPLAHVCRSNCRSRHNSRGESKVGNTNQKVVWFFPHQTFVWTFLILVIFPKRLYFSYGSRDLPCSGCTWCMVISSHLNNETIQNKIRTVCFSSFLSAFFSKVKIQMLSI